jgi:hypothetical protein
MIPFRILSDADPALAHSSLLKAALCTIEYVENNGPIRLTPAKALKRYFVQWAAEAFNWPNYTAGDLYAVNKVLNEHDFPPLMVLHDVLLSAKLARHYKGVMRLTKLARELKERPAALWTLLATHLLCIIDHTRYTRLGDQLVGDWEVFLNIISVEAQCGVTEERLCSVLFGGSEEEIRRHDYKLAAAFYIHALRPLCWAGLLEEHRIGRGLARRELYTKTPLWPATLTLETDSHLRPVTRH